MINILAGFFMCFAVFGYLIGFVLILRRTSRPQGRRIARYAFLMGVASVVMATSSGEARQHPNARPIERDDQSSR